MNKGLLILLLAIGCQAVKLTNPSLKIELIQEKEKATSKHHSKQQHKEVNQKHHTHQVVYAALEDETSRMHPNPVIALQLKANTHMALWQEPALSANQFNIILTEQEKTESINQEMADTNQQPDTLQTAEEQGELFVFTMPTEDQMKMPEEIEYEITHPVTQQPEVETPMYDQQSINNDMSPNYDASPDVEEEPKQKKNLRKSFSQIFESVAKRI